MWVWVCGCVGVHVFVCCTVVRGEILIDLLSRVRWYNPPAVCSTLYNVCVCYYICSCPIATVIGGEQVQLGLLFMLGVVWLPLLHFPIGGQLGSSLNPWVPIHDQSRP